LKLRYDITRRLATAAICVTLGLTSCKKPVQVTPLKPVLTPVALDESPPRGKEPLIEVPQVKMPPVPTAAAATRLPREHKRPVVAKTVPPETPAPGDQPAAQPAPEAAAIGSLTTTGATTDPQAKQDAADLITSNEKRLGALSQQKLDDEKAQVNTARNFQKQAQEALSSGDAEGAKTLATKAKLLLDDIEK
jgi:hypothetical protein